MKLSSVLSSVLDAGWQEVWMLGASLTIFSILGVGLFRWFKKRGEVSTGTGVLAFLFPFNRYEKGQLRIELWMLIKSRLIWFPLINVSGMALGFDLAADLNHLFGRREALLENPILILCLQVLVSYLSLEFAGYWAHRSLHTSGFLWYTHRAHHSAEVLSFLTGGRGHPLEHIVFLVFGVVLSGVAGGCFLFCTGTSMHPALPISLVFLGLFAAVMDKISHSEVPLSFGVLDYVFTSARMHRIHHSAELIHRDKNFGGTLSLFDWIFGTAYRPAKHDKFRLGLSEGELGENNPHKTLKALYLEPFLHARDAWRQSVAHGRRFESRRARSDLRIPAPTSVSSIASKCSSVGARRAKDITPDD